MSNEARFPAGFRRTLAAVAIMAGLAAVGSVEADPLSNYNRGVDPAVGSYGGPGAAAPAYRYPAGAPNPTIGDVSGGCRKTFIERRYSLC